MVNPDIREKGKLFVHGPHEFTYLRVLNASYQEVAASVRFVGVEVDPGIYLVQAMLPGGRAEKLTTVEPGGSEQVNNFDLQFDSAIPLNIIPTASERQQIQARDHSKVIDTAIGDTSEAKARLFLFARTKHGASRQICPAFALYGQSRRIIFPDVGTYNLQEGWMALTVDLPAGIYVLEQEIPGLGKRDQALFVEEGWETQVFVPWGAFPDFAQAILFMFPYGTGFDPFLGWEYGWTAAAVDRLLRGLLVVAPEDLDESKPLLRLLTCYTLLDQPVINYETLHSIAEKIRQQLPHSPDARLIALLAELRGDEFSLEHRDKTFVFEEPPLLARGTEHLMRLSAKYAWLCPADSQLAAIATRLTAGSIWTRWDASVSPTYALGRLQTTLQNLRKRPGVSDLSDIELAPQLELPLSVVTRAASVKNAATSINLSDTFLNLNEVGAFTTAFSPNGVTVWFGMYLPGIEQQDGYEVLVRVIHKDDRFTPEIRPLDFSLTQTIGVTNNLWQANVTISLIPGTHFGQPGKYLYRYQLLQSIPGTITKKVVTTWFTDPFAQATDVGELAAFVTPGFVPDFAWTDGTWKVPELDDLIVYELHIGEFNSTFDGVIERLPYLKGLGVNCLELMPVTSLKLDFDWGYGPLHLFAPSERWGGVQGFKRLINACHNVGIAVILDVVYQHVDKNFPYCQVYRDAGIDSPMIGGDGPFGPEIDFSKAFAREYVRAANFHLLHEYHVDGFRYDEVTDLYDGPTGIKYARIAYETYNESFKLSRFTPSGGGTAGEYSRIIQCPEALGLSEEILKNTYSNCTWQDDLLNKAESLVKGNAVDDRLVELLVLDPSTISYPKTKTVHDVSNNPVEMPVAPFQYVESHDHSQLICFVDILPGDVPFGDRSKFYRLQPFAIALYTCKGIPMLWQGQEFAENYKLPDSGNGRICFRRDVRWEYFYDDFGRLLVRLYRILGRLRHTYPALRSRESFYYKAQSQPENGIVAYRREDKTSKQIAMVFLNFSDVAQSIAIPFPEPGTYQEMIDDDVRSTPYAIVVDNTLLTVNISVPSHYGYVFIKF